MAKLFFYYSTMNAGKSTNLLQASYNYKEMGFDTIIFNYCNDKRSANGEIDYSDPNLYVTSRIGIREKALPFNRETNLFLEIENLLKTKSKIGAVLVDESQFLSKDQVYQLSDVVDVLGVSVLCYGIRTDFLGEPFEGSMYLLSWADEIVELKTICDSGKKATFVLRLDDDGNPIKEGSKELIGSNQYKPVSRKRHKMILNKI